MIFVFRLGQPYLDTPAEHIATSELPPPPGAPAGARGWTWSGIGVARRDPDGTVRSVFASAVYAGVQASEDAGGGVFELDVAASGLLRPVPTSTIYGQGHGPGALSALGDGGYVAVGASGLVLSKVGGDEAVKMGRLEPEAWFRRVLVTPDPDLLHVAGSENGHLAVGDFHRRPEEVRNTLLGEVSTSVTGLSYLPPPEARVLVGTFASGLWQVSSDRPVSPLRFGLPSDSTCATIPDACGFRTLDRARLAGGSDEVSFASAGRCANLISVDVRRRCGRVLPASLQDVTGLEVSFGILTALGTAGEILELHDWE